MKKQRQIRVSPGGRKGMKKYIKRFVEEANDLLIQVGNETFYGSPKEYKEETNKSLANLWIKVRKVHFNNDEGNALFTRLPKNKNNNGQSVHEVIHLAHG